MSSVKKETSYLLGNAFLAMKRCTSVHHASPIPFIDINILLIGKSSLKMEIQGLSQNWSESEDSARPNLERAYTHFSSINVWAWRSNYQIRFEVGQNINYDCITVHPVQEPLGLTSTIFPWKCVCECKSPGSIHSTSSCNWTFCNGSLSCAGWQPHPVLKALLLPQMPINVHKLKTQPRIPQYWATSHTIYMHRGQF